MMTSSNGNIFPRYWPFVRGIHRSPVNSPHKGQWRGALMFSLICVWINGGVNNREAGDLRCYHAHYNVTVMLWCPTGTPDPDGPNRLMTELLYIYRPRQFHTTCDGTNRPSGCGVTVSTKFGWMNGSDQWKNGWKDRHGLFDSLSYFPSVLVPDISIKDNMLYWDQNKKYCHKYINKHTYINTLMIYIHIYIYNEGDKADAFCPSTRGVTSINHLSRGFRTGLSLT